MYLVSNVPHPLRPSTHISPSGYHCPACFSAAQAEATVFFDTAITHDPNLMALNN